jgi:haloalkane dehalogenase
MKSDVIRTPETRFEDLVDFPFAPNYADVPNPEDGLAPLRMHYIDEGPRDAEVVLCMHGEPMWSYLYRKMIPVFVAAGYRVVAPDHIGFGRSDKLSEKTSYTFERHIDWLHALVVQLDLRNITLFCQDWGGPIGLAVLAREEGRFLRAVAANTMLHTVEPEFAGRLVNDNHGVEGRNVQVAEDLLAWILYSQRDANFTASLSAQGATQRPMPKDVAACYDAPFPDERYKQGMRQFPALIPVTRGDVAVGLNNATWEALARFERPFLTLFGDSDPGTGGWDAIFQERVPGAKGQPHEMLENTGHFLQEDCGDDVAKKVVDWMVRTSA